MAHVNEMVGCSDQSSRRSAAYEDWLDSRFDAKSLIGDLSGGGLYLPAPGKDDHRGATAPSVGGGDCMTATTASYLSSSSRPQAQDLLQELALDAMGGERGGMMLPPSCLRSEMYGEEQYYFRPPAELHTGGFKSEIAMRRPRGEGGYAVSGGVLGGGGGGSRVLKLGRVSSDVKYEDVLRWYERDLSYCDAQSVDLLDGNIYLCFESEEDAQLVYEYLRTEIVVFSTVPGGGGAMFGSDDEDETAGLSILSVSLCLNAQEIAVAVANKILLVTVNEVVNPVTMSMLVRLFSLYGAIEKIITFTKSGTNTYQALIQYATKTEAREALVSLEGKMLYSNSNRLEIVYSKLSELNIQHNNTKAWDFTVNAHQHAAPSNASNMLSAGYSDILGMPKLPKEIKEWKNNVPVMTSGGSVLIVYHLSTQNIDDIFNIFSLYGVVTRIKILREKPDTALVQFSDCVYASLARYFLNLIALWTEPIQIGLSKITEVKMPNGVTVDDDCLKSKAYSQSDQRFCEPVKFAKSACFPTNTIFIASIADETPHKRIIDLVSTIGPVNEYEIRLPYPGGPKKTHMLVEYPNTDIAIRAIAALHNQELNGSQIKIAFSKVRLTKKKK